MCARISRRTPELRESSASSRSSGSRADRQSELIQFQCGLNYRLTKKIDIGATYNTSAKFSDFNNDAYFNNIYMATVRATF